MATVRSPGTLRGDMRSSRQPPRFRTKRRIHGPGSDPDLAAVLSAASTRRGTRLEVVCWDLNIDEARVGPIWDLALRDELLSPAGIDPTGRPVFKLTARGHAVPRHLKQNRR
jgi:hypothetical protein